MSPPAANVSSVKHEERVAILKKQSDAVTKFFKPMQVRAGDWLETHKEKGETFEEYLRSDPTLPTDKRKTLYIQPIGKFSKAQTDVIKASEEYMKAFYDLPVKLLPTKPLGRVPKDRQRVSDYPKRTQIRTNYFLETLLPKLLPDDAAALIAFTDSDLYPGETWAFVFGQASLVDRVGVWSLYRLPEMVLEADNDPDRLLMRTLKIAMHETGHMFSMRHCTKYECLMSGTNHLSETDRRPVDTCPECTAKIAWAMKYDPKERYERLAKFWEKHKRPEIAKEFRDKAKAVSSLAASAGR
ncbi:MAG: hypothetical protein KF685_13780 [Acidobacteria bacterium]|nr:hypothetical protein [Acidobacteriota bacterium]